MDARDNGENNPFENTLCCLEWVAFAMEAARRHNEEKSVQRRPENGAEAPVAPALDSTE